MGLLPDPLAPAPLLAHHPLVTHPQAQKARAAVRHPQVQYEAQMCTDCPQEESVCYLPKTWCDADDMLQVAAYLQL